MDGESLDVEVASFDAVVSRVGLIYFPNRQQALAGMRRVLKPGGRIAAMVYTAAERNQFFSLPVSIIRRRAQLPPPVSGQPGPFSLAAPGVLEGAYREASFHDIKVELVEAPLRLPSAAECVRFERESFGALHQMLAGVPETERESVWEEIEGALAAFETAEGFAGPCEMLIAVGPNSADQIFRPGKQTGRLLTLSSGAKTRLTVMPSSSDSERPAADTYNTTPSAKCSGPFCRLLLVTMVL